ncbi:hypothetical protein [Chitinolyticbacter meiyuanensis]|uniref:hypothetical protein n=1 Tax=Chitinolyticbacter meiyuanensis TaxID=682798 RepID=UPI0011E5ECCB|nr:hypothetical protein [Chitinolyticbacter meiyuanensis]
MTITTERSAVLGMVVMSLPLHHESAARLVIQAAQLGCAPEELQAYHTNRALLGDQHPLVVDFEKRYWPRGER